MDWALSSLVGKESKDIDKLLSTEHVFDLDDTPKEWLLSLDYQSLSTNGLKNAFSLLQNQTADLDSLVILFKLVCSVRRELMSVFLRQVPLLNDELNYWKQRLKSPVSLYLYGIEMMPRRLGHFVVTNFKNGFHAKVSGLSLQLPIYRLSSEIRDKIDSLTELGQVYAKCLGILTRSAFSKRSQLKPKSKQKGDNIALITTLKEVISTDCGFLYEVLESILGSTSIFKDHQDLNLTSYIGAISRNMKHILTMKKEINVSMEKTLKQYCRPSIYERYWLGTTISVFAAAKFRNNIQASAKLFFENTIDTVKSFFETWIVEPIVDMLNTIRRKELKLAIVGVDSLNADVSSLERMVTDYARDHGVDLKPDLIAKQVIAGDISLIMRDYEAELKTPIKSFIAGSMVRSLLIQMQKLKVDGAMAMTALDKLLRSNELNFAFLAVMPALAVTYYSGSYISSLINRRRGYGYTALIQQLRANLRRIELLMRETHFDELVTGNLIFHLVQVYRDGSLAFDELEREMFLEDVNQLQNFVLDKDSSGYNGIQVIERMWRMYPRLHLCD